MMEAVYFHDEMFFAAEEVDDIGSKGNLPCELEAIQAAAAEVAPEPGFFLCLNAPQAAGLVRLARSMLPDIGCSVGDPLIRPSGPPSPRGGEGSSRCIHLGMPLLLPNGEKVARRAG